MAEARTYSLGTATMTGLGEAVEAFLRTQDGLEVEGSPGSSGYLVQARQRGGSWRKYVGLGMALQVRILPGEPGMVSVDVGQGKWIDKLGVGTVGALVAWPLLVTAGVGAVLQVKLVNDVYAHIESFLSVNAGRWA
ncbi:MAG: hypothetical protein LBI33_01595 [Propionibacteriaceae bacterium]|jgi:hypothetical protein|nr:hypothetical protein [Propionibacteriaceae bacterium]